MIQFSDADEYQKAEERNSEHIEFLNFHNDSEVAMHTEAQGKNYLLHAFIQSAFINFAIKLLQGCIDSGSKRPVTIAYPEKTEIMSGLTYFQVKMMI